VLRATTKISRDLGRFCGLATTVCVYKGISQQRKGKYASRPFLLSFRISLIPSQECYIFIALFQIFQYWPPLATYSYMEIWPYGQI
jgi:hypothetical protein